MTGAPDGGLPRALRARPFAAERPFAALYLRIALALTGRAVARACAVDPEVRSEFAGLAAGFTFALRVHPAGPSAAWRKEEDGSLSYIGAGPRDPDVLMRFLHPAAALGVLTFSRSAYECYARNGLAVSGDLGPTMAFIRALGIVETLLLPAFVARRILKRPARMGAARKHFERLALYAGLPFSGAKR